MNSSYGQQEMRYFSWLLCYCTKKVWVNCTAPATQPLGVSAKQQFTQQIDYRKLIFLVLKQRYFAAHACIIF